MNKPKLIFLIIFYIVNLQISYTFGQSHGNRLSEPEKAMTLHVIPQSHIDLAWWWRYDPHTVNVVVKHTLETAFENMEKYPDYTFTFLQVPSIEPVELLYPELFYKMRYYVHNQTPLGERIPNPSASGTDGRFAIGSGLYCELDGSIPCGESLVRQCLYGKRYYKHQFGIDVKTAWFQDAWTHPWTFPQILKKCGIDSYMYTRPRPEEKFMLVPDSSKEEYLTTISKEQTERMFWWESADGSRIFAYKPLRIGGENLPSDSVISDYLNELKSKYGVTDGITLIGVGNHGGGAIRADVERMYQSMQNREDSVYDKIQPLLKFSKPEHFVSAVLEKSFNLPVVKDELIPTIRGIYTTVGEIKKGNRYSENLLMTLEKFAAIASMVGIYSYPQKWINESWKKIMLSQFHDTISGTDINPSIDDALKRYRQILSEGNNELQSVLKSLAKQVNTSGKGIPIVVFNPLSWERTDIVEAELKFKQEIDGLEILDSENKKHPAQIIEQNKVDDHFIVKAMFIAKVPSLGYTCYRAIPINKSVNKVADLNISLNQIENEFYRIKIDSITGNLTSIFDKKNNQDVLDKIEQGNKIQILEDFGDSEGFLISPKGFGEYDLWSGEKWDVNDVSDIQLLESGPVRATIQIKKRFQLARFIQRIHLYNGIPKIDFELIIDWNGKNKMVKVAFPLSVQDDSATYEIPYGTIKRPSLGEEHVAQKWVDISNQNYGVSLINDSRYGYDVTSNTIRLSVLRSPDHPVFATDEKGIHQLKYALYPHKGNWRESNTMLKGYEFNYPLIAVQEDTHEGKLPTSHSFINSEPGNIIIPVLKKAEDSNDIVLRIYETEGDNSIAKVRLSDFLKIDAVHKTDMMEHEMEIIPNNQSSFEVEVGKYSIETFKLIKDNY